MNYLYMAEKSIMGNSASTKARNDVERILAQRGYSAIGKELVRKKSNSIVYYAQSTIHTLSNIHKMKKQHGVAIVFQYPLIKGALLNSAIKQIAQNNDIIFIIHDLNYIRNGFDATQIKEEIAILKLASTIICHNYKMKNQLVKDGIDESHLIVLDIFDYLVKNVPTTDRKNSHLIAYAGNLKKGGFIEELSGQDIGLKFNLYGVNYEQDYNSKLLKYKGSFSPEELPIKIEASYGLVWDSTSIDDCIGNLGIYTMYNNPHKLSAYIAAGLPVIVWSKSAIAKFVQEKNIGFTVGSLSELSEKISNTSDSDYNTLLENVKSIQMKITNGYYLNHALDICEELIEEQHG